jgi:hypothetical protein
VEHLDGRLEILHIERDGVRLLPGAANEDLAEVSA